MKMNVSTNYDIVTTHQPYKLVKQTEAEKYI